mgnify:CR=1 FL=1
MARGWKNWSGSVQSRPAVLGQPKTLAELGGLVRRSAQVRVTGAGHSFTPLCETRGTLISLADLEGELELSADKSRAWAPAGWSLKKLTTVLWEKGASLINQGDVNPQALAGAIATGTHGTGATLGSLSTAARGFELMLADGSLVSCSTNERSDLYEAARLSLGLLGVATRIEVDVLPAYHLEEKIESHPLGDVAERWDALIAGNRHAEFFIFPYGDQAILKTLNVAPSEGPLKQMNDMDDHLFRIVCDLCSAFPALTRVLQPRIVSPGIRQRRVGPAYQIFPSERTVRFEEMEYEMPIESGWPALREAIDRIKAKKLPVTFPFEFRITAGDDIWLSPFNGGPRLSISMHQYARMPWQGVFDEIEPIFRAHGGRPHWAKRHSLTAQDVNALYPQARRFGAVRAEYDPTAKFANAHLTQLFNIEAAQKAA